MAEAPVDTSLSVSGSSVLGPMWPPRSRLLPCPVLVSAWLSARLLIMASKRSSWGAQRVEHLPHDFEPLIVGQGLGWVDPGGHGDGQDDVAVVLARR